MTDRVAAVALDQDPLAFPLGLGEAHDRLEINALEFVPWT